MSEIPVKNPPYRFDIKCESCGSVPTIEGLELCAPCTYGEADSVWEWAKDTYKGKQLKLAKDHINDLVDELSETNMDFELKLKKEFLRILTTEPTLDDIETILELLFRQTIYDGDKKLKKVTFDIKENSFSLTVVMKQP